MGVIENYEIPKGLQKQILNYLKKSKTEWTNLYPFIIEKSNYTYNQFYKILTVLISDNRIVIEEGNNLSFLNTTVRGKLTNKSELNFRLPYKEKEMWYNKKWVGHSLTFIAILFAIFQWVEKRQLASDFSVLKEERDSLKLELDSLKYLLSDYNYKQQTENKLE